jgi:hypothetical protein
MMFKKDKPAVVEVVLHPEILTQPNIPKPLHGLNPRTLKGDEWWDRTRQEVYASTGYHCYACGVHKRAALFHKWLEAHEMYKYDYEEGVAELIKIIPLCHACHNFIHSGRLLAMYQSKEVTKEYAKTVLERGFRILAENKLECFPGTLITADHVGCDTYCVRPYKMPDFIADWCRWRLIMDGQEHYTKYDDIEEWHNHYQSGEY